MKLIASYMSWYDGNDDRQIEWVIHSEDGKAPFPNRLPCDGVEWSLFRQYVTTWVNKLLSELGHKHPVSAFCTADWHKFDGPLLVVSFPTARYETSKIRRKVADQLCEAIEARYASEAT